MRGRAAAVALTLTLGITSARAQYLGPWTNTWDFNDGTTQGWTLHSINGAAAALDLDHLVLHDGSYASLPAPVPLGGNLGQNRFVVQTDVYVGATNYIQDHGIGVSRSDGKGPSVGGSAAGYRGTIAADKSWDCCSHRKSYSLASPENDASNGTFSPFWATLQLDYGFSVPGKWSAWVYTPFASYTSATGWTVITSGRDVHPGDTFTTLTIGALPRTLSGGAWAQAQYDSVRLVYTPEPAAMLAAILLVGAKRTRKVL